MHGNTPPKAESPILISVRKYQLDLSEPAELDFRDILSYTLQKWGERQFIKYKDKINSALLIIENNPAVERKIRDLWVYHTENHLIYYRITDDKIYVIRILHERMNAIYHL